MESFEWVAGVWGVVAAFETGTSYTWLTVM